MKTKILTAIFTICCVFFCKAQIAKTGQIITYKMTNSNINHSRYGLIKYWIKDDMMRYYEVDSLNSNVPASPIGSGLKKNATDNNNNNELKIGITSCSNIQIVNLNTRAWWVLINDPRSEEKIAIEEKPTAIIDSSAFFKVIYTNKYKNVAGYKSQKVILKNKKTKVTDSLYLAQDLAMFKNPYYTLNRKYGIKGFIVEAYSHYGAVTLTVQLVKFKEENLSSSLFEIPKEYKNYTHDEYYKSNALER